MTPREARTLTGGNEGACLRMATLAQRELGMDARGTLIDKSLTLSSRLQALHCSMFCCFQCSTGTLASLCSWNFVGVVGARVDMHDFWGASLHTRE